MITRETVALPGDAQSWDYCDYGWCLQWLDADSVVRPPSDVSGWMVYDAPAFDEGRPIDSTGFPLSQQDQYQEAQYSGTPLIAGQTDSDYCVDVIGVNTIDGYQELVDLSEGSGVSDCLDNTVSPVEIRPGVYEYDNWCSVLVVDVVTGQVYDYGFLTDPPDRGVLERRLQPCDMRRARGGRGDGGVAAWPSSHKDRPDPGGTAVAHRRREASAILVPTAGRQRIRRCAKGDSA